MAKKNNGFAGMDFTQIMMQQVSKALNEPVYCRYCGKNLKEPTKESKFNGTGGSTGNYSNDWEIRNNAHEPCYQQNMRGRGRR